MEQKKNYKQSSCPFMKKKFYISPVLFNYLNKMTENVDTQLSHDDDDDGR